MAAASPVYSNIPGAPFKIGELVRVIASADETQEDSFIGKTGRVVYLEYDCGCGQTFPGDPMIGVEFDSGRCEEFWAEEMASVVE